MSAPRGSRVLNLMVRDDDVPAVLIALERYLADEKAANRRGESLGKKGLDQALVILLNNLRGQVANQRAS